MIEEAVAYIAPVIPPEHLYVITSQTLLEPIRASHCGIPAENILAEPCKRNTCGCLAYAAAHCLATYGGDGSTITMAVLTADHTIGDSERFQQTVEVAPESGGTGKSTCYLGYRARAARNGVWIY